ncbi:MAG TPA: 3-oxoacyl-ACP synthase [Candidatus Binatia bacterium]|jgi:3-oxoacyl-[acyl-carrier-protein] synthase-3
MSSAQRTGILGVGYQVPNKIRKNDDPIFKWYNDHHPGGDDFWNGFEQRRVLAENENLRDLMWAAAQKAIVNAKLSPSDIGALIGYGSVGEYVSPNELAWVHQKTMLPPTTWVLPVDTIHGNFLEGLMIARSLVQSGQVRNVLVVCGGNWTKYVDYYQAESLGASDGAGAAVYGVTDDPGRFELIDSLTYQDTSLYGALYMQSDRDPSATGDYTRPFFHVDPNLKQSAQNFAKIYPLQLIQNLLSRYQLSGEDIALITHQTGATSMNLWQKEIQPGQYLSSLKEFGNMTMATLPVNLAHFYKKINKDYLVFLSLGIHLHTTALLLKRNTTTADQPK